MSPALMHYGAPIHFSGGVHAQVSHSLSFHFVGSLPLNFPPLLEHLRGISSSDMNLSNFGDLNSGFSNPGENNVDFSFNSSSYPRSSGNKGVSKPRLVKMRKQLNSHNSNSAAETWVGTGFNPFRPTSDRAGPVHEVSVLGAIKNDLEKKVLEDMKNMRIGSGNEFLSGNLNESDKRGFVFGTDHGKSSVVNEDMKKLTIDDRVVGGITVPTENEKGKFESGIGDNVGGSAENSVESVLLNDFKKKLNIEQSGDFCGTSGSLGAESMRSFGTGSGTFEESTESALPEQIKNLKIKDPVDAASVDESGSFTFPESSENALADQVKNLDIKDSLEATSVNNNIDEKSSYASRSMETVRDFMGGERKTILLDEMSRKLNIANVAVESSGQTGMEFSSSQTETNKTGSIADKRFHDFGNTVPTEFIFKGQMQGNNAGGSQLPTDQPKVDPQSSGVAGPSFAFSSSVSADGNASRVPLTHQPEKIDGFCFTSKQDNFGSPFVEFKMQSSKGNIFSGINQKLECTVKFKDSKAKKKRGKLKQPTKVHIWPGQHHVPREGVSLEIPEASEPYSPMDVSPYQETVADAHISRETSVTSDESFSLGTQHASTDSQPDVLNDAIDEDLVVATQQMDINSEHVTYEIINEENVESKKDESFVFCFDKSIGAENPLEDSISGAETESFKSANEEIDFVNDIVDTSAENDASSNIKVERQDSDIGTQFSSAVNSEDIGFMFSASSAVQASSKRHLKKKNSAKLGHESYDSSTIAKVPYASSSLQFTPFSRASLPSSPVQANKVGLFTPLHVVGDNSDMVKVRNVKQEPDLVSAACIAAQETCEKWRLRGNQAYRSGDLSKAEDFYTQGVNCIDKGETSRSCLRALMLCYSNRAATCMSLGRMRDALGDCKMAAAIDPTFLKVKVRAASCYLSLGEVEEASQYFKNCLQFGSDVCVDRKIAIEASEGLQKAQKVSELMQLSVELLQRRTSSDAGNALQVITEALNISPYSEKLLQMKAESLFMLQKYKEVIQLCEQTFDSAKRNSPPVNADYELVIVGGSEFTRESSFRLWRCCLIFKSYFYLGKLEEAISSLEKQEELDSFAKSKLQELLMPYCVIARELLQHKAAGNEAFQAGKHSEAIEHYSIALSRNVESRPFAAICFCNRAAAYKALGQIIDAIADCSLAIALNGNYLKAISRRANLYEMIRDYGQAAKDLQRLVAALTKQVEEKSNQVETSYGSTNLANDLRQARLRLSTMEDEGRMEIPLNMYLILGVEPSASASEIKKAYRKAALRHHPDKAGQSLARGDNGDDGLWKEIGEEVHKDADRLFKMIGEAYQILSDPTKRSHYDLEEEMRAAQKNRSESSTYKTHADAQNYPFDRSSSRRHWREVWRSYGR